MYGTHRMTQVTNRPMVKFHKKLKFLKSKLQQWNKKTFGHVSQEVKHMENAILAAEEMDPSQVKEGGWPRPIQS